MLKRPVKLAASLAFLALLAPVAALAGFGRFHALYTLFAHLCALVPGLAGDYVRTAYYVLTLRKFGLDSRISFGSYFAQPDSSVGRGVYIGAYCVIGRCRIGDHCQIASQVQILSGRQQHERDASGHLQGADTGLFEQIQIGEDCWIGASAVVMANVGSGTTIGAGAVVVHEMRGGVVAVGNPARVVREACDVAAGELEG